MLFPVIVTEKCLVPIRTAAWHILRFAKHSAQVWSQLEHLEAITGHHGPAYAHGGAVLPHCEIGPTPGQDVSVDSRMPSKCIVSRPREGKVRHAALAKCVT